MTEELMWLFVAIGVLGILNLLLAIHDERQIKAAKKQSEADRQIWNDIHQQQRQMIGPMAIPPHLQNLGGLSNDQIRGLVEKLAAKMRVFETETAGSQSEAIMSWRAPEGGATEENRPMIEAHHQKLRALYNEQQSEFFRRFQPDCLALLDEITERQGVTVGRENHDLRAVTMGIIAGPWPIHKAANELERMARLLPEGS